MIQVAKELLTKKGPLGFYQGVVPYLTADGISGVKLFLFIYFIRIFA